MKRIQFIIIFLLPFFCATISFAQEKQLEISASYGFISGRQIADGLGGEKNQFQETGSSGNYFISCHYYINDNYAIGFSTGLQNIWGYVYYPYNGSHGSNWSLNHSTIAFELKSLPKSISLKSRLFQYYILLGIGGSFNKTAPSSIDQQKMNGLGFNFQCSPVCFSFGRKVSGFVELGLGYKGLLNMGLSCKFGKDDSPEKKGKWW